MEWVFIPVYPGHVKLIFLSLFSSQFLANYVVVQRWILPRDVIKEIPLRTVTSCVMECSGYEKCTTVGFRKNPFLSNNDKCLLVKLIRKKDKNATRKKIFALIDEEKALNDEKEERRANVKHNACPVDVNGDYGNWSNFTVCTQSCGSGVQFRNRSCDHPTPKYGGRNCSVLENATEERSCNIHHCPIDGGYGQWSSYRTCSKTCGTGEQQRTRLCDTPTPQHGGKNCSSLGESTETRSCNIHTCQEWPEGAYGILTRAKCPKNWHEYTQCYMFAKETSIVIRSSLDLGECNTGSSMTFRYCFKGSNVSSRAGGFFTKSGSYGSTYVIKNVNSPCKGFGSEGDYIYLDLEDSKNGFKAYGNDGINHKYFKEYYPHNSYNDYNNIMLYFCEVGEQKGSTTSDYIRIGEFNQKFGLFSNPDSSSCPVLDSPHGILSGNKEIISFTAECCGSRVHGSKTPFIISDSRYESVKFGICVYNP